MTSLIKFLHYIIQFFYFSVNKNITNKEVFRCYSHSDMSTTANIYSHLDAVTKADTGAAMSKALG